MAHLGLGYPIDAHRLYDVVHPAGRDPLYVALANDLGECSFCPPARFEQPARVVAAFPQLGHGQVHGAGPGVEVPVAVAVAGVHSVGTALAVTGATDGIGLGRHEPLGEALHHLTQQVGVVLLELLAQPAERVQAVKSHRISPLGCWYFVEVDAVVVASGGPSARQDPGPTGLVHHSCGLKRPLRIIRTV
jgi:hypothetical protein